jgi:hypothetical protein
VHPTNARCSRGEVAVEDPSKPSAASVSAADSGDDCRNTWSWLIASMRGVRAIASDEIGVKMLSNSTPPTRLADSCNTWSSWRCTPNISYSCPAAACSSPPSGRAGP